MHFLFWQSTLQAFKKLFELSNYKLILFPNNRKFDFQSCFFKAKKYKIRVFLWKMSRGYFLLNIEHIFSFNELMMNHHSRSNCSRILEKIWIQKTKTTKSQTRHNLSRNFLFISWLWIKLWSWTLSGLI